jgi:hypothetical protein
MSVGRDIDTILAQMRMLAHGPAARPMDAPFIKGGKAEGNAPRGYGDDLFSEWFQIVERVKEAANLALNRAKQREIAPKSKEDRDRRILQFHEGDDALFVAYVMGLSEDHIRKVRREADRLPNNGKRRE